MTYVDLSLVNQRVMAITTNITLSELLQENLDLTVNMNKRHMDIQILRIITPQPNQNALTRYQRTNQTHQVRFNRFILCRIFREHSILVYVMMSSDVNGRLFHRDLVLRDNGVISIGSFLRILAPHQIDRNMQDIPLLRTDFPAVALCAPSYLPTVNIKTELGNK